MASASWASVSGTETRRRPASFASKAAPTTPMPLLREVNIAWDQFLSLKASELRLGGDHSWFPLEGFGQFQRAARLGGREQIMFGQEFEVTFHARSHRFGESASIHARLQMHQHV